MSNYKLIPLIGEEVREHIPEIAAFRIEIFAEYPFLYEGDYNYENEYLKKYLTMKDAIIVLAYDGKELIGLSTGYPFVYEEAHLQKVLKDHELNPQDYFCFGESMLRKMHRGKGIGSRFFELREAYVKKLKCYSHICFYTVVRPLDDPKRPKDYHPLDSFWQKRGYIKQNQLIGSISWKEIGEKEKTAKPMIFWTKKLSNLASS